MNPLVHGPILGTLLALTWPNLLAMGSLVFVSVSETWVVGQLGLPSLYRLLGGEGEVLAIASRHSLTVFAALPALDVVGVALGQVLPMC